MNTKLPEWYDPRKELERITLIEKQCLKTIEKAEPKLFKKLQELLNKLAVTKKELAEDIIKYGVYNGTV